MDTETTVEATSPASKSGDGSGSSNITTGQAAAILFASELKNQTRPEPQAVEDVTPEESETPTISTAEADEPAAEPTPEESAPAEDESETAEGETEGEEDSVLSHKSPLDPKTRADIQKRINKEVAKRKALEDRIQALDDTVKRLEVEKTAPAPQPPPVGKMPLAEISDLESLEKHKAKAKEAARWARDQLDRDDFGDGIQIGNDLYDKSRLKGIIRTAEVTLEDHIPARERFLREKSATSQKAVEMFPFLQDKTSPDFQLAVAAYRQNPWLLDLPNADFIVGVQVEGLKAINARQSANATPAEKPKPKPVVAKPAGDQTAVSSGAAPARAPIGSAAKRQFSAERDAMMKKGAVTANEAAALLMQREQVRKSR